jgi:hypothetical protein
MTPIDRVVVSCLILGGIAGAYYQQWYIMYGAVLLLGYLGYHLRWHDLKPVRYALGFAFAAYVIWYLTMGTPNYWLYYECRQAPTHHHCWQPFCETTAECEAEGYSPDDPPPPPRWIP